MAQTDIFGNAVEFGKTGIAKAKDVKLTISGQTMQEEYLVQFAQVQYSQPVNLLHELGSNTGYYHTSFGPGSLSLSKIIGKKNIIALLGDPGKGIWIADNATPITCVIAGMNGINFSWEMYGCILTSINFSGNVNSPLMESATIIFAGLDIK